MIETEEWADEQQLREKWTVSLPQVDLAATELVPLSDGDAREIFGSLHFLRSFRTGAQYFGLRDARSGSLLSCCGVAPSRWQLVTDALAKSLLIAPGEILDLCRMYTLPGAPRNSISRLLRLLVHESASWSAPAQLLTTVVDQNLGFTGSAYASANWPLLAEVEHLPYRYVDKRYRTAGQLFEQYRTMESAVLAEKLGPELPAESRPASPLARVRDGVEQAFQARRFPPGRPATTVVEPPGHSRLPDIVDAATRSPGRPKSP